MNNIFTFDEYNRIMFSLSNKFTSIFYDENRLGESGTILLRHDVDIALSIIPELAMIEKNNNQKATYFLYLHSPYYNLLDKVNIDIVKNVIALGHKIGLHFDPQYYDLKSTEQDRMSSCIALEKEMLEQMFQTEIDVVSFHNPTVDGFLDIKDEYLAGMLNVYSDVIFDNYSYCSDSNGIWRYSSIWDYIEQVDISRVQVLFHPVWWSEKPFTPKDKIVNYLENEVRCKIHSFFESVEATGRTMT